MIAAIIVLLALLIVQGLLSLIEGIRFLRFVRRSLRSRVNVNLPKATIIAPCKGMDNELKENLEALFDQDYPQYELIFVIASPDDEARRLIERAISDNTLRRARLVIARPDSSRSEKVNNLLCAIENLSLDTRVIAFIDSDGRARPNWLRELVAALDHAETGAATGYRWYLPERGGFFSALLSAWNGSVATTLGDHNRNFAWGGATAILKETFDRIDVRRRWQTVASDDYALTRAVEDAGLRIRFNPRCMMISKEDASLASLLEFTTRQIIITRVYRRRAWWIGFISQLLFNGAFFGGLIYLAITYAHGQSSLVTLIMLSSIYILGSAKGLLRLVAASLALEEARSEIMRLWWMYCLLWPLVSVVYLYNFILSATTRQITWRGVTYELRSPSETVVITRASDR